MGDTTARVRAYYFLGRIYELAGGSAASDVDARAIAASDGYSAADATAALGILLAQDFVVRTPGGKYRLSARGGSEVEGLRARRKR